MVFPTDENVIVGLDRADDAGVYKISDDLALIQTVDFFTPIVDDPYWFGQIAAANALSDVYAMGGVPKTAMNLVAFPVKEMDISILRRIIQGGVDKLTEAGVVLVGGHSVEDRELKYGLSVTGFIHPLRVLTKKNLRPGDRLILTKPLGTGIVNTAIKAGMAPPELVAKVTALMAALNRTAAEVMASFDVHACTDVTGFGLLGHLAEMVSGGGAGARVFARFLPVIPEALEYASMGLIPAGAYKNKEFREAMVVIEPGVDRARQDLLFDPQTSGGLLIGVNGTQAVDLAKALKDAGIDESAEVGEVLAGPEEKIWVV
jgi:selenide,water dikinase